MKISQGGWQGNHDYSLPFDSNVHINLDQQFFFIMRIRITGKRVAKGNTGIVYDVLYIVSRTKELGLPADLLSMPEEPSKRGEMVSRSSAEARDRTAMEARFTAKKREYESSIAREKWQVKCDIQKDNRMVVSGGCIKRIMRGDCLGLSFFTRPPRV